jgi:hypothetical protein
MCVRNGSPSGEPLAPAPARAPETIESPAKPRAARSAGVSAE